MIHNVQTQDATELKHNQKIVESRQMCVGLIAHWSVHAAELIRTYQAIGLIMNQTHGSQCILCFDVEKVCRKSPGSDVKPHLTEAIPVIWPKALKNVVAISSMGGATAR